jgi:hypothetical protein
VKRLLPTFYPDRQSTPEKMRYFLGESLFLSSPLSTDPVSFFLVVPVSETNETFDASYTFFFFAVHPVEKTRQII